MALGGMYWYVLGGGKKRRSSKKKHIVERINKIYTYTGNIFL